MKICGKDLNYYNMLFEIYTTMLYIIKIYKKTYCNYALIVL